jgi:hypothetical protein
MLSSECRLSLGYDQPPPALDDAGVAAGAAGADPPDPPDPLDTLAVNELTEAVTSLPVGATSHHFAPNPSLPCPVAVPEPESPEK